MDESQDKCTDAAGNYISRPAIPNVSLHNASDGIFMRPVDVRPNLHPTSKCSAPTDQAK
jgi:hypothetical protein